MHLWKIEQFKNREEIMDMKIIPEDTCCVVVDYQERILPAMAEKESLLENSIKLLEGLKILEVPVMVTAQYAKGLGLNVPEIQEAAGTEEYFDKKSFSIFEDEAVREKLRSFGKKNVILCGIEAHICILQSIMGLVEAGYRPVLIEDCVSSRKLHDKEVAVVRAAAEGAIVTTCESLLFEMTGGAGSDKFKQISNLVK